MKVCPRQLRIFARSKLGHAVRRKVLPRVKQLLCVDCGGQANRYDHRDYTKPLDVDPVCHRCDNVRGQGAPDINGPCVDVDWLTVHKVEVCGECSCPTFGRPNARITDAMAQRAKVWRRES